MFLHIEGGAVIKIVVEGSRVTIEFESPDDVSKFVD